MVSGILSPPAPDLDLDLSRVLRGPGYYLDVPPTAEGPGVAVGPRRGRSGHGRAQVLVRAVYQLRYLHLESGRVYRRDDDLQVWVVVPKVYRPGRSAGLLDLCRYDFADFAHVFAAFLSG